jgi:hypothetical protein
MPFIFDELEDPIWQMLSSVKRPSRYAGGEWGADGGLVEGRRGHPSVLPFPTSTRSA